MATIVPAIIPTSREDLEEKLTLLAGLCDDVQVDVVDGRYAAPASWPYNGARTAVQLLMNGEALPHAGPSRIEIDLMADDPEAEACAWEGFGASRITLHAGSTRHIARLLAAARSACGHDAGFAGGLVQVGIALGAQTETALIEPFIERVDYVQFMGIRTIGRQGEPFEASVVPRIRAFRKKYPKVPVQVDGAVSLRTAPLLLEAGVSRLVVGSALWSAPDLRAALDAFQALTEHHGIYE